MFLLRSREEGENDTLPSVKQDNNTKNVKAALGLGKYARTSMNIEHV